MEQLGLSYRLSVYFASHYKMKPKRSVGWIVVASLAYLVGLSNASAFYDPGAQRWLNRDPIGERGFVVLANKKNPLFSGEPNRYEFNVNNPISVFDLYGLDACLDAAGAAFSSCMCFVNGQLGPAYDLLHKALQALEIGGVANSNNGIITRGIAWGVAWEVRLSIILLGAMYGGAAAGCGADAIGKYYSCQQANSVLNATPPPFSNPTTGPLGGI